MRRTPLLVRHNVVLQALQWLVCNHSEYKDIDISLDNLAQYPQDEPPVQIVHRDLHPSESGDTPAEALPSHPPPLGSTAPHVDDDGPCPFAVHGLTGTQYVSLTYDEKVALAVKHFTSGESVLAYGHFSEPSSIYNDAKLFPRLFPWLYPYGVGGFGN
ncbi:uncharacterized protein TRAVEDRAFT_132232, partial [Trametes versicolor FP-101664 SS1]|uniref:uncharacterized protein n=1 Tax=Trametes versicolor (strain FP-101664) TaxID=717944 RepID=UPI0004621E06